MKKKSHLSGTAGPGSLSVRVLEAKCLPLSAQKGQTFCRVSCNFSKQTFNTTVKRKTTNPVWKEDFNFYVGVPAACHSISVNLFFRDLFQPELYGEAFCPLQDLLDEPGDTIEKWYPLQCKGRNCQAEAPQILVKMTLPKNSDLRGIIKRDDPKKHYAIEKKLGEGTFGVVRLCVDKKTKKQYAIKVLNKQKMEKNQLELLKREIAIMSQLSHPAIIHLEQAFDTDKLTCLVLELASGGSVLNHLLTVGPYDEKTSCVMMKQLLEGCQYLNSRGIAHRDLKPDNLLLTEDGRIKISDFGLSKDFSSSTLVSPVGTANYVAPEVLSGSEYDSACDVWSCGVICYILLSAQMPFFGRDNAAVFEKILNADYNFPDAYFKDISDDALDFVDQIFVLNPMARATYPVLLSHHWILSHNPTTPSSSSTSS